MNNKYYKKVSGMNINEHTNESPKLLTKSDAVNHPSHYNSSKYECIDVLRDLSTPEEFEGFLINNVRKYLWRYKSKNGLQDLEKAEWYLKELIKEYKNKKVDNE